MLQDFLGFLVVAGISLQQVTHQVLVAFMQYWLDKQCTHSDIANYLTGVRVYFVMRGCDTTTFRYEQLQYFQKPIKLYTEFKPKLKHSYHVRTIGKNCTHL